MRFNLISHKRMIQMQIHKHTHAHTRAHTCQKMEGKRLVGVPEGYRTKARRLQSA